MNKFGVVFKFFALLLLKVLGYINHLIPKKNQILLYSNNQAYNDNNYALLHKLIEGNYNDKYTIIQSVIDYKDNQLQAKNLTYIPTYLAPFCFLRSKFVFYDGGTVKIKPSKKQVAITLWHGIPLKKIGLELDKKNGFLDKYNQFTKIIVPHENLKGIFSRSFGCSDSQILINGYPRNDFLLQPQENILERLNIYKKEYQHTLLWMPTYRKTLTGSHEDSKLFENEIPLSTINTKENLLQLDNLLQEKNILLVIKPHPYCILNTKDLGVQLSNIKKITNTELNSLQIVTYSFVSSFDGLLTDYSSVLFDYLLLNKPIAFTIDDLSQYSDTRGMNFKDPLDLMAGAQLSNFNDFYQYIKTFNGSTPLDIQEKTQILRNRFHKIKDSSSTETLLHSIGLNK